MKVALPPAWVMVSVGLILNITAIILSSQVLDKNVWGSRDASGA